MISNRLLGILAIAFVLLCALDVATWPRQEAAREAQPLFAPFTVDQAVRVEVQHPSAPEGERELLLTRHSDGHWVMENHHGFPVRAQLTESLLQGLATLTTLDLLTEDEASHARYGVQEGQGVRLRVTAEDGRVLADLFQGDLAPGGRARYVRRFDGVAVYRAPHFDQRAPAAWAPWADSRWMPLDKDLVQRITIEGAADEPVREWSLQPGSRLQWQNAQGEIVPRTRVEALLTALSRITLREIHGAGSASWEGEPGALSLRLELAGGLRWSGQLAPEAAESDTTNATPATVDRHGRFRVGLAPKATAALRQALAGL